MGSGRASATLVLPPTVTTRAVAGLRAAVGDRVAEGQGDWGQAWRVGNEILDPAVAGLRAAVGDRVAEGQGDWGQAWRVGNEILDPAVAGEARDQTLTEALRPWVKGDGWGAPPGGAAFWDDPDPAWGAYYERITGI